MSSAGMSRVALRWPEGAFWGRRRCTIVTSLVLVLVAFFYLYANTASFQALWQQHTSTSNMSPSDAAAQIAALDGLPWTQRPRVVLAQGEYVGTEIQGTFPQVVQYWLGIPYAESTAGLLGRFREPRLITSPPAHRQPVPSPEDRPVFEAGSWGHRCPSTSVRPTQPDEGEDCLNVNVFRAKSAVTEGASSQLPVLVYFHGGAFNFGTSSSRAIRSMVAWSPKPFIGVSFNYRTGAFGFLTSALSAKAGILNLGLKDQHTLLRWVKQNIAAFGGDPDNITLMGQSAGAHSIGHHLLYKPHDPPPFKRVILESGAPTARAVYSADHSLHEEQFRDFIAELDASAVPEEHLLDHLRGLPWEDIKKASERVYDSYNSSMRWPFQPVIDGPSGVIGEAPVAALQAGKFHRVPILTGFNTNEGATFVEPKISGSAAFTNFYRVLLPLLTEQDRKQLESLYPDPLQDPSSPYGDVPTGFGDQFLRAEAAYSHYAYIGPVRQTAWFASTAPMPANASTPRPAAYLYNFAVHKTAKTGANHGDQIDYSTFNRGIWKVSAMQKTIAGYMHAYLCSFILTGDPNAVPGHFDDRPPWLPYEGDPDPAKGKIMRFGVGNDERVGGTSLGVAAQLVDDEWARKECSFWWSKVPLSEV